MKSIHSLQILIMHQGAIGDLILSLPAFHALRRAFPQCHCEALGHSGTLSLVYNRFYIDSVVSIDKAIFAPLYQDGPLSDSTLQNYFSKFHYVIVFGGKAHIEVVHKISSLISGSVFRIDPFPKSGGIHVIDYQLGQLQSFGIAPCTSLPMLFPAPSDMEKASDILLACGIKIPEDVIVAVHPGSGSEKKNWPTDYFITCLREISSLFPCHILLIEGPADQRWCREIESGCQGVSLAVVRKPELVLVPALLKYCHVYIGNDSGITHIAAATGVPTIALFGPTDPEIWGPRGKAVFIVRDRTDRQGWKWPSPEAVIQKLISLFDKRHSL